VYMTPRKKYKIDGAHDSSKKKQDRWSHVQRYTLKCSRCNVVTGATLLYYDKPPCIKGPRKYRPNDEQQSIITLDASLPKVFGLRHNVDLD